MRAGPWTRRIPAVVVLCIGASLSVLGFQWMRDWEGRRVQVEFDRRAAERIGAVRMTIALNQQVLSSVGSLYAASMEVERHEFRAFAGSALSDRPAILALLWAPRVRQADRESHEATGRSQGLEGYRIVEGEDRRPAQPRGEYFPVFFSEPAGRDACQKGFDLASDPDCAALMVRARGEAEPAASGQRKLPHADASAEGVMVFLPIFLNEVPHDTQEERVANLDGFVVAVVRVDRLLDEALRSLVLSGIRLSVVDEATTARERICSYPARSNGGEPVEPVNGLRRTRLVNVGGRHWSIECVPTRGFSVAGTTWLPLGVLVGVLLVTLLLAGYLMMLVGRTTRVERLVATRTEELARSNAELERFAYVASHDLQEPLRMVSSFLQLLVEHCGDTLDAEAQEFIGYAVDGSHRMQALIRDLLTYSRVGRRGKELAPVDCEDVFAHVYIDLEAAIQDRGAAVTHDSLPTVMGDDVELGQLFQNLVSNAVKFCRDKAPRVHMSATRNGSEWVFAVRDNGIGIEPQYVERIFQMFQRLHTRTEYGGTGIGLAICKKIVERHGGRIWVDSTPGKGSTFFFTLPATVGEPS